MPQGNQDRPISHGKCYPANPIDWPRLTKEIRKRDGYRCANCQAHEYDRAWDVHHKIPLKSFANLEEANDPSNLITLCPRCHHLAEQQVRIQSGLSGLRGTSCRAGRRGKAARSGYLGRADFSIE